MGGKAQNQDPATIVAAPVEERAAAQSSAVEQRVGAVQALVESATEPEVEAETAVAAESNAQAGARGVLGTAKSAEPAFKFILVPARRRLRRPVREPEAGDDAQRDQP